MPINFKAPHYNFNLPWYMFDIDNKQLITSIPIPSTDISDAKDVILTEQPIPGASFSHVHAGGMGNRKISFTLPVVKRNNTVGNILLLRQFQNLREPAFGWRGIFKANEQFKPNPRVLYAWGLGAVPLIYFVKKCDFKHKQGLTNNLGYPQYTDVDFELWLDENHPYNKMEMYMRRLGSIGGMVTQAYNTVESYLTSERPY